MRKFIFALVAAFVMSFAACGNHTTGTPANDSDSVTVDSIVDSTAVDSLDSTICLD